MVGLGFLKQLDGSLSKANFNRENLIDHLNRYAYHGFAPQQLGRFLGGHPSEVAHLNQLRE